MQQQMGFEGVNSSENDYEKNEVRANVLMEKWGFEKEFMNHCA